MEWSWLDGGLTLGLRAELPAASGAAVIAAIERRAAKIPVMPEEELHVSAQRADALAALCTEGRGTERSGPPATVMVHVQAEAVASGQRTPSSRAPGWSTPRCSSVCSVPPSFR
jgi:hypothetical protein